MSNDEFVNNNGLCIINSESNVKLSITKPAHYLFIVIIYSVVVYTRRSKT